MSEQRPVLAADSAIFVAGHGGMVGSAICRALQRAGYGNLITRSRQELDLCDQAQVRAFLHSRPIDQVVVAAAKVGGIHANATYPASFIYDNLMIEANLVEGAWRAGIQRLLFLGSSCIYPRDCPQPMKEEALLSGPLEPSNAPYAVAKIAGLTLCDAFNRQHGTRYRALMPTNLYGPNDNFHPENSHVIPGLLHRFHQAAQQGQDEVVVWGSGRPRREFLHVDDLAEATVFVMELADARHDAVASPHCPHLNVGCGSDITIAELAALVARTVGFSGRIRFDAEKPDGTPRKLLDVSRMTALGWQAKIPLARGLAHTYAWYLDHLPHLRES